MDHRGDLQSATTDIADFRKVKPFRRRRGRQTIASLDPRAQEMWAKGYGVTQILRALGMPDHRSDLLGFVDPTPQPLGCPPFTGRAGESGEARAFRRFPINAHKPGLK